MNSITSYVEERKTFPSEPFTVEPGVIYVFQNEGEEVDSVDFLCPCGCGSTCYTPVVSEGESRHPQWKFSRGPNGVTLTPSIRYTGGCFAHFNITDGQVQMHGDSGIKS